MFVRPRLGDRKYYFMGKQKLADDYFHAWNIFVGNSSVEKRKHHEGYFE